MDSETLQSFGERAVLAGEHTCEPPPRDGAPRWPLSIVMMPPPDAAETVSALTRTAITCAVETLAMPTLLFEHWRTGVEWRRMTPSQSVVLLL